MTDYIIGVEWDSSNDSPNLRRIDGGNNTVSSGDWPEFFNSYPIHGNMWRGIIADNGDYTYGSDAKGTGLTLTTDNVMVRIPRVYVKFEKSGDCWRWWVSPIPATGFDLHPAFYQRGHSASPANQIYIGSYDAHDAGSSKLGSKSGSTPLASQTIATFETRGNNIGTGWGNMNFHTLCLLQLLFYVEFASFDSRSKVGPGRTKSTNSSALASGGASSYEAANGTSSGTTDVQAVAWRGIENLWGNVWQCVIGYNTTDTEHRIVNRDGTGTLAASLTAGNYESVTSPIPLNGTTHVSGTDAGSFCHGYVSDLAIDASNVLGLMFVPDELSGSSDTYLTDYYYSHRSGISQTGGMLSGNRWDSTTKAGLGCQHSTTASSYSDTSIGARLESIMSTVDIGPIIPISTTSFQFSTLGSANAMVI